MSVGGSISSSAGGESLLTLAMFLPRTVRHLLESFAARTRVVQQTYANFEYLSTLRTVLPLKTLPHFANPKPKPNRLGPAAEGQAKIIVVAKEGDRTLVELERLPEGSSAVLFRGSTIEEFSTPEGKQALAEANVLLNCVGKQRDGRFER